MEQRRSPARSDLNFASFSPSIFSARKNLGESRREPGPRAFALSARNRQMRRAGSMYACSRMTEIDSGCAEEKLSAYVHSATIVLHVASLSIDRRQNANVRNHTLYPRSTVHNQATLDSVDYIASVVPDMYRDRNSSRAEEAEEVRTIERVRSPFINSLVNLPTSWL